MKKKSLIFSFSFLMTLLLCSQLFAEEDPLYAGVTLRASPSGPEVSTTSTSFVDIPFDVHDEQQREKMGCGIITEANSKLRITFCGEARVTPGSRMFVRALVDGQPAKPSDVVFASGDLGGTHAFTFVHEIIIAGGHWIQIQWRTDSGGTAFMGDRTLTLCSAAVSSVGTKLVTKAAPSGPSKSTTSTGWVNVPDLSSNITTNSGDNLEITVSAEAYASGEKRLFLRALVDGQPTDPSDVVFASGVFHGARSFTFTKKNLGVGGHQVQIQWHTDTNGAAFIGDRTLSIYASPLVAKYGGLSSEAPPSGPNKTTSATGWVDVPDLSSSIATAKNSVLEITVCGEWFTSEGKRTFIRAMVDGHPATPSDVVFSKGGFTGLGSFTFTKENLNVGPHEIKIQWHTDPGGTAFVGDRTISMIYRQQQVPDLSKPYYSTKPDCGIKPIVGKRNVLVLLWDPQRADHPAPSKKAVEDLIFGPNLSVNNYFVENSGGRFSLENVGVLGWYKSDKQPGEIYWCHWDQEDLFEDRNCNGKIDPGEDLNGNGMLDGPDGIMQNDEDKNSNGKLDQDLDGDGWIKWHTRKWWEAIRNSDSTVQYKKYDVNNDGVLTPDELTILVVIPQSYPFGTQRDVLSQDYPIKKPLKMDDVTIPKIVEAYIGCKPSQNNCQLSIGLVAHELSHILLNADDMYFQPPLPHPFYPYRAGVYSLMDASPPLPTHLDPFHKLRLGWAVPRIVTYDAWYKIQAVETSGEVFVLCDPFRGNKEYFIIENRWKGPSFDSNLPDAGLAVWHIIEDQSVFSKLPAPAGVDATQWDKCKNMWGRRAIRMIRPVYGPPNNNALALWDGSDPQTGYDLLSVNPNPAHATLRWCDNTPSGFSVQSIPPAGEFMTVYINKK